MNTEWDTKTILGRASWDSGKGLAVVLEIIGKGQAEY